MCPIQKAVIFANGELKYPDLLRQQIRPDDYLIAADGGYLHLRRLGWMPSLAVGDFDSLAPADLDEMRNAGVELAQYPRDKDETDLELALLRAAGAGYTSIRIAAGLGGRLDQTLGNVFLMNLPQLQSLDVRLEDGHEEVFIIRGSCQVQGYPGDVISLLPLFGPAYNVTTQRLRYPLNAETLWPEHTRGISNVMLADTAQISLNSGLLLCIHTREVQS